MLHDWPWPDRHYCEPRRCPAPEPRRPDPGMERLLLEEDVIQARDEVISC